MTRVTYNFIRGMGSVLDLVPSPHASRIGTGLDLDKSDAEALREDWQMVAEDFHIAFDHTLRGLDRDQAQQDEQA